jgi:hypothetical protein
VKSYIKERERERETNSKCVGVWVCMYVLTPPAFSVGALHLGQGRAIASTALLLCCESFSKIHTHTHTHTHTLTPPAFSVGALHLGQGRAIAKTALRDCCESFLSLSAYCQQEVCGWALEWKKQNLVLQSGQVMVGEQGHPLIILPHPGAGHSLYLFFYCVCVCVCVEKLGVDCVCVCDFVCGQVMVGEQGQPLIIRPHPGAGHSRYLCVCVCVCVCV